MQSGLETVQWAWRRIEEILEHWISDEEVWGEDTIDLFARLNRSLRGGLLVISALEEDLRPWTTKNERTVFGIRSRAKAIWNEHALKDHQDRIRDQVTSMTLLISVIQMPTAAGRRSALDTGRKTFAKSDESAYSVVPSRSSGTTRDSESLLSFGSDKSPDHRELSVDSILFTSRVYKRTYWRPFYYKLVQKVKHVPSKPKERSDHYVAVLAENAAHNVPGIGQPDRQCIRDDTSVGHPLGGSRSIPSDGFNGGETNPRPIGQNCKPAYRYLGYESVAVLILCWDEHRSDRDALAEFYLLSSAFLMNLGCDVWSYSFEATPGLHLQKNLSDCVASFVNKYAGDQSNTLLIVYYVVHGKPGVSPGALEISGQIPHNNASDTRSYAPSSVVWGETPQNLLREANADVLQIFDLRFEILAATDARGTTPVPGPRSFTTALCYALEMLVDEKPEAGFTTEELLNRTKAAPHFSKTQSPILSGRRCSADQSDNILLRPLRRAQNRHLTQGAVTDNENGHTVTMHLDFGQKPSAKDMETLGRELNWMFERSTLQSLKPRQILWGGMKNTTSRRTGEISRHLPRRNVASETLEQEDS
ncbi:MAG: hypothetical protein Q9208_003036 [Pyrenodesmia sp. 3 TL-2023]